jgi:hypothetical protein
MRYMRNSYNILAGIPEGKMLHGGRRSKWGDIRLNLKGI